MKTITVNEPFIFTLWDFMQLHSLDLFLVILIAVAASWVFAEKAS